MKKILKISFLCILIGIGMITLAEIGSNENFFSTMNKVVISEFKSGIYSENSLDELKYKVEVKKDIKSLVIRAKYVDVNVSDTAENITVEYYNLPTLKYENENLNEDIYDLFANYSKYNIVFNQEYKNYERVKITIPKDNKFEHFWIVGKEVNINGVNSNYTTLLNFDYDNDGVLNLTNVNTESCRIINEKENITIKNSNIKDLSIENMNSLNFNNYNINFENVKGDNLNIGSTGSREYMIEQLKDSIYGPNYSRLNVSLKKSEFKNNQFFATDANIEIDNNSIIDDYNFNIISISGNNKINNKKYESEYNNKSVNSKYKIDAVTKNLNIGIN